MDPKIKLNIDDAKQLLSRLNNDSQEQSDLINVEKARKLVKDLKINDNHEISVSSDLLDFEKARKLLKNPEEFVSDDFVPLDFEKAKKLLENVNINELDRLVINAYGSDEVQNHEKLKPTKCNGCNSTKFNQYRYKCLECTSSNFNLCGDCFEQKIFKTGEHQLTHAMVRRDEISNSIFGETFNDNEINLNNFSKIFTNVEHKFHSCNGCNTGRHIVGLRFKCDTCNNFDLCKNCFFNRKNVHPHNHSFIAFGKTLNQIDSNEITKIRDLGQGAFGCVFEAKLKNGNSVACKILKDSSKLNEIIKEKEAYDELIGVNILKCFGFSYYKGQQTIITELMKKGSLNDLLRKEKISYKRKLLIACDISSGMLRIHQHGFIHFDIRDDNVLIAEDYTAKIGDMGIVHASKMIRRTANTKGKPDCMPPEFFNRQGNIDQKLDVFTYGLILNQLFDGKRKFIPPNINQLYDINNLNTISNFRNPNIVQVTTKPAAFYKLVSICLNDDPKKRFDSKKLFETLKAYKKVFSDYFAEHHSNYDNLDFNTKNEVFKQFFTKLPDEKILR